MNTLLDKVAEIEREAQALLDQAEKEAEQRVQEMADRREAMLSDVRTRAEQRAEMIRKEMLERAKTEANDLKQIQTATLKQVKESAAKNRSDTLQWAIQEFRNEYGLS